MLLGGFLASKRLHILRGQNNYAYVITQNICNKFIEIKFSVGCMVWASKAMKLYSFVGVNLSVPIRIDLRNIKNNNKKIDYKPLTQEVHS